MFLRVIGRFTLPLVAASLLVVAACGGDDDDDTSGTPDAAANNPDSAPGTPDAAPTFPDAPPTPDANTNPTVDAGGTSGQVYCGEVEGNCTLPEICCVTGTGGNASAACTAEADCTGAQTAKIMCDGPEDCDDGAGEVCCGNIGTSSTSCVTTQCFVTICHGVNDCPGENDQCCPTDYGGYCSGFGCF